MAKGAQAKAEITETILKTFPNSFINEKEIRIPMIEDGAEIQIKVTLTAAKDLIVNGNEIAKEDVVTVEAPKSAIVSEEEKKNVSKLLASLGL